MIERQNAYQRGYDRRWNKASSEYLWRNPWCLGCLSIGVKRKADLVDHVIPHKGDQARFWSTTNWQPCCSWHHNAIKPELERLFATHKITAAELRLHSDVAMRLTRAKYAPAVGADGFRISNS